MESDKMYSWKISRKFILLVSGILLVAFFYVRMNIGERAATSIVKAIAQQPIELKNAIENIPASSWQSHKFAMPYSGSLRIDATVVKGNGIDIFVIDEMDFNDFKSGKDVPRIADFEATKTKNYSREKYLKAKTYYLILKDSTLGILSQKSSDVKILIAARP
jgi:hypothetical protein